MIDRRIWILFSFQTTAFERLRGFQKVEELISNSDDPYVVIRLSEKDFWALYNKKSIELAETERIEGQTAVNMYFRNPPKFDANVQHTATPKKSVQRESTPLRDVNQNERKRFLY